MQYMVLRKYLLFALLGPPLPGRNTSKGSGVQYGNITITIEKAELAKCKVCN